MQSGLTTDCVNGSTILTVNATCNVRVRFQPTATGSKTATLSVSASPGGSTSSTLTGTGLAPGQLSGDATTHNFEATEVQVLSSSTFTWTVTNTGQATTGVPSLSNNNGSVFYTLTNNCTAALAPGATCTITTRFRPLDGGVSAANLTLTASPGGSVGLVVKGEGLWRLTVTSTGTGTVSSTGISCGTGGTDCTELFAHNSVVTLNARPANGSGFQFGSWSGNCVGAVNDCTLTMTGLRSTTANFTTFTGNLAFVSSANFPADLGGVAAYDNQCNALATAAGINDANGTAFKAWISDGTSNAVTRLGATTGGWRTLDKRIFARSMIDLVDNRVLNPITITEKGAKLSVDLAWTATKTDGTVTASHCTNWSTTAGNAQSGFVGDGPGRWTATGGVSSCTSSRRLYCLQTTSTTPIAAAFPPPDAKIIYYTDGFTPGGGVTSANAHCNAHKPPIYATRTFRALVATSTQRIYDTVSYSTLYYRPDGTFVGSGSNLSNGTLASGIWQRDDGTYPIDLVRVWSGATGTTSYGSVTSSCNDWTYNDPGATGVEGLVSRMESIITGGRSRQRSRVTRLALSTASSSSGHSSRADRLDNPLASGNRRPQAREITDRARGIRDAIGCAMTRACRMGVLALLVMGGCVDEEVSSMTSQAWNPSLYRGFLVRAYAGRIVKNGGKCLDYKPDAVGTPLFLNDCNASHGSTS